MRKCADEGLVYLDDNDIKRNPFVKVCERKQTSLQKLQKECG